MASKCPVPLPAQRSEIDVRHCFYGASTTQPRHAHDYTNITFVVSGSLTETVGTKTETAGPLSIVIKPVGTEHADEFGTGGAIALSMKLDQRATTELRDWDRELISWRWQHGGTAARWFLLLLRSLQAQSVRSDTEIENILYEVVASLSREARARTIESPRWLLLIKQEIDDDVEHCGRVRDLAARAGVHPVYLARQFRSHLGVSVSEYVTQRRVAATAQLLSMNGTSLAAVACQAGFSDQSHMGRIFKSKTGLTPDAYRQIVSNVL